ncbi:hypothetical protein MKHDV_00710 [Halodesulfovibrio sp. MK-HDV]|nr:hypothetical protein MKHDV_00710 [Halodesulfovibrio sp. MK-HDV]
MKLDTTGLDNFIDEKAIWGIVNQNADASTGRVQEILDKALEAKGLTLEETACLLQTEDPELNEAILETAGKVKQAIYGKRVVLFALSTLQTNVVTAVHIADSRTLTLNSFAELSILLK